MTHTTDQDRAEFLAWVRTHEECHGAIDEGSAWAAWQAARRAQVVPKGWKLVPMEPTMEMVSAGDKSRIVSAWMIGGANSVPAVYSAMLAAAPQPPEEDSLMSEIRTSKTVAAPVQMPEPVAFALEWTFNGEERGMRLYDDETHCRFDAESDGGVCHPLYTEHQVRQLLAAQQFTLDELAMLTRKLVQQLRKASPGDESAEKALDYLKRKGLAGNPLRATQEQRT